MSEDSLRTNIRDVAEAAGVSVATVSRVLSGSRPVTPELADRVRIAARQLGYRPNHIAKSLRMQRTGSVGVVVPRISNPFFTTVVEHLEHQLQADDLQIFLCDSRDDSQQEHQRIEALLSRQVDAIVLFPCKENDVDFLLEVARRVPLVVVDRYVDGLDAAFVAVDNVRGVSLAVEHLHRCGADSMTLVTAGASIWTAHQRRMAFDSAAGVSELPSRVITVDELGTADGGVAAQVLSAEGLQGNREGILCANDLLAIGLVGKLRSEGFRFPRDALLVGFDDIEFARMLSPSLTTVQQPVRAMAASIADMLREASTPEVILNEVRLLEPKLIVRESTGRHGTRGAGRGWS